METGDDHPRMEMDLSKHPISTSLLTRDFVAEGNRSQHSRGRICCEFCKGWHNAHCFQDRGPRSGIVQLMSAYCCSGSSKPIKASQHQCVRGKNQWLAAKSIWLAGKPPSPAMVDYQRACGSGRTKNPERMSSIRANAPALINTSQERKRKTTVLVIVLAELCIRVHQPEIRWLLDGYPY